MIRKYSPSDFLAVLALIRLNSPKYFHPSEEEDLIKYLKEELEEYYVVEIGSELVGAGGINFGFSNDGVARISWDLIHPEWQGKGIGSKLTLFRINEIKKNPKVKRIEVRTSQLVYTFYQKMGFKLVESIDDYWSEGLHLYRMEQYIS